MRLLVVSAARAQAKTKTPLRATAAPPLACVSLRLAHAAGARRFLHTQLRASVSTSSSPLLLLNRFQSPSPLRRAATTPVGATRCFQMGRLYAGQDAARQNEKKFSELSGKIPWEPEMHFLENIKAKWLSPDPNLNELIRDDLPLARQLFRNTLQQHYAKDMGMWNKWGCMEWKAGNYDLARMIFAKAAKVSFHAELWQSWATMEMEAKNYREAKRLYKLILATDPQNAMAGLGRALLEAEIGQHTTARELFQDLLELHGDDVLVLQAYAVFEAKQQNTVLARELFEIASRHRHATAQVWHAWGKAEFDAGYFKNALVVLNRGMHHFPTHKWLVQLAAMAHHALGDIYEARRGFHRLVAGGLYIEPSSYNAYANMEQELGYDDIAVALYLDALRTFPEHVPSAMSLAILYHKMGKLEKARKVFENALERIPIKHSAVQYVADMMYAWGVFEEQYALEYAHAKELYTEVTKTMPAHADGWKALARVESRLGNLVASRAVLARASETVSTDVPLLVEKAKIEQKNRNFAAARRAFEQALKLDPSRAAVWNMRALLELPLDPERTKNIIENALSVIPKYEKKSWAILMCTYGRAFAAMEDYEKAVAAFQNSFKLGAKNWETHVIYAETVLQPNGAWKEARKHLVAAWKLLSKTDKKRASLEKKILVVEEQLKLVAVEEEQEEQEEEEGDEVSAAAAEGEVEEELVEEELVEEDEDDLQRQLP